MIDPTLFDFPEIFGTVKSTDGLKRIKLDHYAQKFRKLLSQNTAVVN